MKKSSILLVFLCGLLLAANGQTENEYSKFWLGGSVGLNVKKESTNYNSDEETKAATYKILPEFGWNFSKYWALGVSVGYSHAEENKAMYMISYHRMGEDIRAELFKTPWYKETATGIHLTVFTRFSFLQGSIGKLFLDAGIQYMWGKSKLESLYSTYYTYSLGDNAYNDTADVKSGAIGVRPGGWINVTKHIALTGRFGFLGYQYLSAADGESSTYGLDFDMSQFQIGVNIVL